MSPGLFRHVAVQCRRPSDPVRVRCRLGPWPKSEEALRGSESPVGPPFVAFVGPKQLRTLPRKKKKTRKQSGQTTLNRKLVRSVLEKGGHCQMCLFFVFLRQGSSINHQYQFLEDGASLAHARFADLRTQHFLIQVINSPAHTGFAHLRTHRLHPCSNCA